MSQITNSISQSQLSFHSNNLKASEPNQTLISLEGIGKESNILKLISESPVFKNYDSEDIFNISINDQIYGTLKNLIFPTLKNENLNHYFNDIIALCQNKFDVSLDFFLSGNSLFSLLFRYCPEYIESIFQIKLPTSDDSKTQQTHLTFLIKHFCKEDLEKIKSCFLQIFKDNELDYIEYENNIILEKRIAFYFFTKDKIFEDQVHFSLQKALEVVDTDDFKEDFIATFFYSNIREIFRENFSPTELFNTVCGILPPLKENHSDINDFFYFIACLTQGMVCPSPNKLTISSSDIEKIKIWLQQLNSINPSFAAACLLHIIFFVDSELEKDFFSIAKEIFQNLNQNPRYTHISKFFENSLPLYSIRYFLEMNLFIAFLTSNRISISSFKEKKHDPILFWKLEEGVVIQYSFNLNNLLNELQKISIHNDEDCKQLFAFAADFFSSSNFNSFDLQKLHFFHIKSVGFYTYVDKLFKLQSPFYHFLALHLLQICNLDISKNRALILTFAPSFTSYLTTEELEKIVGPNFFNINETIDSYNIVKFLLKAYKYNLASKILESVFYYNTWKYDQITFQYIIDYLENLNIKDHTIPESIFKVLNKMIFKFPESFFKIQPLTEGIKKCFEKMIANLGFTEQIKLLNFFHQSFSKSNSLNNWIAFHLFECASTLFKESPFEALELIHKLSSESFSSFLTLQQRNTLQKHINDSKENVDLNKYYTLIEQRCYFDAKLVLSNFLIKYKNFPAEKAASLLYNFLNERKINCKKHDKDIFELWMEYIIKVPNGLSDNIHQTTFVEFLCVLYSDSSLQKESLEKIKNTLEKLFNFPIHLEDVNDIKLALFLVKHNLSISASKNSGFYFVSVLKKIWDNNNYKNQIQPLCNYCIQYNIIKFFNEKFIEEIIADTPSIVIFLKFLKKLPSTISNKYYELLCDWLNKEKSTSLEAFDFWLDLININSVNENTLKILKTYIPHISINKKTESKLFQKTQDAINKIFNNLNYKPEDLDFLYKLIISEFEIPKNVSVDKHFFNALINASYDQLLEAYTIYHLYFKPFSFNNIDREEKKSLFNSFIEKALVNRSIEMLYEFLFELNNIGINNEQKIDLELNYKLYESKHDFVIAAIFLKFFIKKNENIDLSIYTKLLDFFQKILEKPETKNHIFLLLKFFSELNDPVLFELFSEFFQQIPKNYFNSENYNKYLDCIINLYCEYPNYYDDGQWKLLIDKVKDKDISYLSQILKYTETNNVLKEIATRDYLWKSLPSKWNQELFDIAISLIKFIKIKIPSNENDISSYINFLERIFDLCLSQVNFFKNKKIMLEAIRNKFLVLENESGSHIIVSEKDKILNAETVIYHANPECRKELKSKTFIKKNLNLKQLVDNICIKLILSFFEKKDNESALVLIKIFFDSLHTKSTWLQSKKFYDFLLNIEILINCYSELYFLTGLFVHLDCCEAVPITKLLDSPFNEDKTFYEMAAHILHKHWSIDPTNSLLTAKAENVLYFILAKDNSLSSINNENNNIEIIIACNLLVEIIMKKLKNRNCSLIFRYLNYLSNKFIHKKYAIKLYSEVLNSINNAELYSLPEFDLLLISIAEFLIKIANLDDGLPHSFIIQFYKLKKVFAQFPLSFSETSLKSLAKKIIIILNDQNKHAQAICYYILFVVNTAIQEIYDKKLIKLHIDPKILSDINKGDCIFYSTMIKIDIAIQQLKESPSKILFNEIVSDIFNEYKDNILENTLQPHDFLFSFLVLHLVEFFHDNKNCILDVNLTIVLNKIVTLINKRFKDFDVNKKNWYTFLIGKIIFFSLKENNFDSQLDVFLNLLKLVIKNKLFQFNQDLLIELLSKTSDKIVDMQDLLLLLDADENEELNNNSTFNESNKYSWY